MDQPDYNHDSLQVDDYYSEIRRSATWKPLIDAFSVSSAS